MIWSLIAAIYIIIGFVLLRQMIYTDDEYGSDLWGDIIVILTIPTFVTCWIIWDFIKTIYDRIKSFIKRG